MWETSRHYLGYYREIVPSQASQAVVRARKGGERLEVEDVGVLLTSNRAQGRVSESWELGSS